MIRLVMLLAIALAAGACGDDNSPPNLPDATPDPDAAPDAPPERVTLTTFVIDLVANQTMNTTAPVPSAAFEALPDPDKDMNNTTAYSSLF